MVFNNFQPIYVQIIEQIYNIILTKEWKSDERIPSVRDMAMGYEVNPNTVMRAYEKLQTHGIIYNKRGMGYFLSVDAPQKVVEHQRAIFENEEMPKLFKKLERLSITIEDLNKKHKQWLETV